MSQNKSQLITGNEAAVLGAIAGGAEVMFGYPITPATEILQKWIDRADENTNLSYLQTEDETAAGFGVIGCLLGGKKSFTASAGPGHILLQDPISMAENLRLPFVAIIMQRGGPSTGTVNFSQQEVNLAAFGGNGDGLRIVYSVSNILEMFKIVEKSFSVAWKYRFPTIVLGDGYLGKMKAEVTLPATIKPFKSEKILREEKQSTNLRNCYSSEEDFGKYLNQNIDDWERISDKISESENYKTYGAKELIIAHGIVAEAAKDAIDEMRANGYKTGLFRPITLNPFPKKQLLKALNGVKKVYIFESAKDQFARIVKYEIFCAKVEIIQISKPAEGFNSEEIAKLIREQ